MIRRFKIWNRKDDVLTESGKVYTADQWIEKYPIFGLESITPVCSTSELNGTFFESLAKMVRIRERQGCDFSKCTTDEEKLETLELFDEKLRAEEAEEAEKAMRESQANEAMTADALTSIAASLEFQNMMMLPDVEV